MTSEVDDCIKERKTQKVLTDDAWPIAGNKEMQQITVQDLLALAAHAPYHKRCHESHQSSQMPSGVPWRFHVLDCVACRKLLEFINAEDLKTGKIGSMLGAADHLFLVTWLPDPSELSELAPNDTVSEAVPFEGNIKNMEHIAASAAAIQNVLIGATARGIPNYWSSGGQLRNQKLRTYLDVPMNEVLLGAIFLFPKDSSSRNADIKSGSLREEGKDPTLWSRSISLS